MSKPEWQMVGKSWREFRRDERCQPGVLVEFDDPSAREIIGDLNALGGYCNDCSVGWDTIVLRILDLRGLIDGVVKDADGGGQ